MDDDFLEIWSNHGDEVARFVRRHVRDVDADDIFGDITIKLLAGWPKLRDKNAARKWLYTVARNEIRNYYKSHHRRFSKSLDPERMENLLRKTETINFDRMAAREFIRAMDEDWRRATVLYIYEGYTHQEIADLTGFNRTTIARKMPAIAKKLASALYITDDSKEKK